MVCASKVTNSSSSKSTDMQIPEQTAGWLLADALETIKRNTQFLTALANDLKAVGIEFSTAEGGAFVRNVGAEKAEAELETLKYEVFKIAGGLANDADFRMSLYSNDNLMIKERCLQLRNLVTKKP